MTQENKTPETVTSPPPYSIDIPRAGMASLIGVPLVAHEILVTTSRHAREAKGSKRKCEIIFSRADKPDERRKLLIWREYVIIQIDRMASRFVPYSTVEQKYCCFSDIPFRIVMNGMFVRIITEEEYMNHNIANKETAQ